MDLQAAGPSGSKPKRKVISDAEKAAAIEKIKNGASIDAVTEELGIAKSTVKRWIKSHNDSLPKPIVTTSGKKVSTVEDDKKLIKFIRQNPGVGIKQAIIETGFPAGEQTAMKRLKAANVKYVGPAAVRKKQQQQKALFLINLLSRK